MRKYVEDAAEMVSPNIIIYDATLCSRECWEESVGVDSCVQPMLPMRVPLFLAALAAGAAAFSAAPARGIDRRRHTNRIVMDDAGLEGTRVWLNVNGERVVRSQTKKADKSDEERAAEAAVSRRILIQGAAIAVGGYEFFVVAKSILFGKGDRKRIGGVELGELDGDAVTAPAIEGRLEETVAEPPSPARTVTIEGLVRTLEGQQGPQFAASNMVGRWVLPWVGGWERICSSSSDASFMGGPSVDTMKMSTDASGRPELRPGDTTYTQQSGRQFVYGPGVGGFATEYLYTSPGKRTKVLVERNGTVTNLGSNYFQVEYKAPPGAYLIEEAYDTKSASAVDVLRSRTPLPGQTASLGPAAVDVTLHTTYLSATMWIIRDDDDRFTVFQRTETRSVMDWSERPPPHLYLTSP